MGGPRGQRAWVARELRQRRRERRGRRDVLIGRLAGDGKAIRAIARELGIDPKTVRQVVRPKPKPTPPPRRSLLDHFRPLIRALVLEQQLTAVRVLEEIRALGYRGGYSILKVYIRSFRVRPTVQPHLRFETGPGEQGQVDLSPYTVLLGEVVTTVVCFSFVLGFSRWQYIRFVLHADAHTVCHGHVLAFEAAGGVPRHILYDRMKQVVIESTRDHVVFHSLFEAMVRHYGYRAVPLEPGYKEGKGKVENPFRYVEHNFLAGRRFHDLADLNAQADAWLRNSAHVRIHGTTREMPAERLETERPHLIALPAKRFDAAVVEPRLVGDDFCVAWDTNRYSVPPGYAGHQAWARVLEGTLEVQIDGQVVAQHALRSTHHQRYMLPEHEAEFRRRSTSRHVLGEQFLRLGSGAGEFADGLRQARGGAAGYHMSRLLRLADQVGPARVAEAMRQAARYGAYDYAVVTRIVTGRRRPTATVAGSTVPPAHIAEFLKGAGSHQRDLRAYVRLAGRPACTAAAPAAPPAAPPEESADGQRRDGPTDPEPPAPRTAPCGRQPR